MFRLALRTFVLLVLTAPGFAQITITTGDVQNVLSRAETLYFEARFRESIQLLRPVEVALQGQANRTQEEVKVKLQLALAHIGLNETVEAKARFSELCDISPNYELDAKQFAPKVLALYGEARDDHTKARCSVVCDEAKRLLSPNDSQALIALLRSASEACSCLRSIALEAADLSYKRALENYKLEDFARALDGFKAASTLNPQHELAIQYIDLTQNKLQLAVDRLVLDWKRFFAARDFGQATTVFKQMASPLLAGKAGGSLDELRAEYRQSAAYIVDQQKQSCSTGQIVSPDAARQQIAAMLPDATIARDLVGQITACVVAPPPPPPSVQPLGCLQMTAQLALVRLKTRVEPEIPRVARPRSTVRMTAKVKIDPAGNVAVGDVQGGDIFLIGRIKAAVDQWKFFPAIVANQPRCVDTELPIVVNP